MSSLSAHAGILTLCRRLRLPTGTVDESELLRERVQSLEAALDGYDSERRTLELQLREAQASISSLFAERERRSELAGVDAHRLAGSSGQAALMSVLDEQCTVLDATRAENDVRCSSSSLLF
jgi:hypothetical protein